MAIVKGKTNTVEKSDDSFTVYNSAGTLMINCTIAAGKKANLVVANLLGQVLFKQELTRSGNHYINKKFTGGLYVISYFTNNKVQAKKIFIGN